MPKYGSYSTATTPLSGTETVLVVQGNETKRTTAQDIADLGGGSAAIFDDATSGGTDNIVVAWPVWSTAVGVHQRSQIDNTKVGIVCLAADSNTDAPLQDAIGVTGNYAFAVGDMPSVTGDYAGGGGYRANARDQASWAFGYSVFADGQSCFAVGHRSVAGALAPADDPSNTYGARTDYAFASGSNCQARAKWSFVHGENCIIGYSAIAAIAMGYNTNAADTATYALAVGNQCQVNGSASVAMGQTTTATGNTSVAMGLSCTSVGTSSVAMGQACTANGTASVAMGNNSSTGAAGHYSVALGHTASATGEGAYALGYQATASGDHSFARGYQATASATSATALGQACTASAANAVAIGKSTTASRAGEFAHGAFANNDGAFKRLILKATSTNGATCNPVLLDGSEITLADSKSYQITVHFLGSRTDAQGNGGMRRILHAHTTGGTLTIDNDTNEINQLAAGWGCSVSSPGARVLRLNCNGAAGQTVVFAARVELTELTGA